MNKLQEKMVKEVRPAMMKEFSYRNPMEVPAIEKVSVNIGLSKGVGDKEFIEQVSKDLKMITGQSPAPTKARKSIAGFKIRAGQIIGLKVTLRGQKMWDFIYRLIGVALPRIKDFQGIKVTNFDQKGNLSIGVKEHLIFPEISTDDLKKMFGFQINITLTNCDNQEEGISLFRMLGFPIKKD